MPIITAEIPEKWERLEHLVAAILAECGMDAQSNVNLTLPRGSVDVDVLAVENVNGIIYRIICECKNWRTNVPREKVHAFRTVIQETGANKGYIISRVGFQSGVLDAATATNIDLTTFLHFQELYFEKWFARRCWDIENANKGFHTYYEPFGKPGYSHLISDKERSAYDAVWNKYLFAGLMLRPFAPYSRMLRPVPPPDLPFDVSEMEMMSVDVPSDIKAIVGYREFLSLLERYAQVGHAELRRVNPVTRGELVGKRDD